MDPHEPMLDHPDAHASTTGAIGIDELVLISRIVEAVSGQALTLIDLPVVIAEKPTLSAALMVRWVVRTRASVWR